LFLNDFLDGKGSTMAEPGKKLKSIVEFGSF
jgi:hypothetical protein